MTERWFPDEMPTPAASAETMGWWEAAADHRLVVQRCTACNATRHPPGPLCPATSLCHLDNLSLYTTRQANEATQDEKKLR